MHLLQKIFLLLVFLITGFIAYLYFVPIPSKTDYFSIYIGEQQVKEINETEKFNIQIEWNKKIRVSESGEIKVLICRDKNNQKNKDQTEKISDSYLQDGFYDHLIVETRIDMPGLMISPGENYVEGYSDSCNKVQWQVVAHEEGTYNGKVWLYFVIPQEGDKEFEKIPILARGLEINGYSPLGFSGKAALIICGIGIILCIVLGKKFIYQIINKLMNTFEKQNEAL